MSLFSHCCLYFLDMIFFLLKYLRSIFISYKNSFYNFWIFFHIHNHIFFIFSFSHPTFLRNENILSKFLCVLFLNLIYFFKDIDATPGILDFFNIVYMYFIQIFFRRLIIRYMYIQSFNNARKKFFQCILNMYTYWRLFT